jgi:histone RNA hairpin-binding protein
MEAQTELQLEYEHIDWSDIVEAELSGDQDTLRQLRDKAAEIKRMQATPEQGRERGPTPPASSPVSRESQQQQQRRPSSRRQQHQQDSISAQLLDLAEYPVIGQSNKENTTLPFANFLNDSSITTAADAAKSYAQAVVTRNAKRTLMDRCLSPSELPVKRPVTSDMMTTPTEPNTFFQNTSPSCETTPETSSLLGKAGLVQRRLFGAQAQEQTKSPAQSTPRAREQLSDPHRLTQRQKQIDFGKNTLGYERYIQLVPKWKRQKTHPATPNKYTLCSTRSWQGQIRVWRKQLHNFDPAPQQQQFSVADAGLCDTNLQLC